jgi:hypothetical protein
MSGRETYERRSMTLLERLMDFIVVAPNACWIWTSARDTGGYGLIAGRNAAGKYRQLKAHRVSYELHVGQIPSGMELDHLCRVRECVNWRHLEPVTPRENMRRSPIVTATIHENKTHCINGHPFSGENLMIRKRGHKTSRACVTCHRAHAAKQAAKLRSVREVCHRLG